ncbi:AarF/UbiB family protein, partial [bacterium]|nr:AarF/UbiB family protein [bacterium]
FITGIISDFVTKSVEENAVKRAIQLREIVTSLGPAYIKLGQALSIRPDILTPAAMNELQKLCDKVPSFDNGLAFATLEDELGCKWQDVYTELGPEPVAAASLGQVYKGVLKETGDIVAVKVQRPAVLETVSVDLYVLRKIGGFVLSVRQPGRVRGDVATLRRAEQTARECDPKGSGHIARNNARRRFLAREHGGCDDSSQG